MYDQLKQAYIEELTNRYTYDPIYKGLSITPEENVNKMLRAIAKGHAKCAWMPYNKALKAACKKVGIKKDSELRELVKANYN